MSLYKGYVPVNGKRSLMPFKGKDASELLTLEAVEKVPSYGGVLDDNAVMVDIDDMEQSETLLRIIKDLDVKCKVIATSRGKHFLFWNNGQIARNGNHKKLAVGLTADIKAGCNCSYEVLKRDGHLREVIYDTESYETIPCFLKPVNTKIDLLGLADGDGRNQTLFSYILPLQKAGLSIAEVKQTLSLVNQYILRDKLSEAELATITRDEAFSKQQFFTEKGGFLFDVFARHMVINKHIVRIDGDIHVYRNGIYVPGEEALESAMVEEIPNLKKTQRAEVLAYFPLIGLDTYKVSDVQYVAFNNGVLNIITNEFSDFSPEKVITNKIPHDYRPDAKSDLLEKTIRKLACNDASVEALLYEALSYSLLRRNELRKSFFLLGDRHNGKSTFLDLLSTMLGEENVSTLDLADVGSEFKTAEIAGKLANIGDDISDGFMENTSIFKKVVSGEAITVNRKYQKPVTMTPRAKFYFSANSLPRLGKGRDTAALVDRMIVIPFNASFSKDDPDFDPFIKYKLREEPIIEALLVKCIAHLRDVLANEAFTHCDAVASEIKEFEVCNNPIIMFFDDLEEEDYLYDPTDVVYKKYTGFCYSSNVQPVSKIEFSKQIRKHFGLEVKQRRNGNERKRYYVKITK